VTGIVLDTCLVSEPQRPAPDASVIAWLESQDPDTLFLTATVVGELALGIERLPAGERRVRHEAWLDRIVTRLFVGRILPFDDAAALVYGRLVARAQSQGRPPQVGDAQIAAVARRHGMTVATRNVRDFEVFGVPVVNPWDHA